jgi:hypothetical protein
VADSSDQDGSGKQARHNTAQLQRLQDDDDGEEEERRGRGGVMRKHHILFLRPFLMFAKQGK